MSFLLNWLKRKQCHINWDGGVVFKVELEKVFENWSCVLIWILTLKKLKFCAWKKFFSWKLVKFEKFIFKTFQKINLMYIVLYKTFGDKGTQKNQRTNNLVPFGHKYYSLCLSQYMTLPNWDEDYEKRNFWNL